MAAVASFLSPSGYEYVQDMMAADDAYCLGLRPLRRDDYYLAFYGEPSTEPAMDAAVRRTPSRHPHQRRRRAP